MMKVIRVNLLFAFLFSGCGTSDEKILDFAGIVFIIFSLIVIMQLSFDKLLATSVYKKVNYFY